MEDFSESLCSLNNLLCAVVEVGISSLYTIQALVIASSVVCRKCHSGSMRRITEQTHGTRNYMFAPSNTLKVNS